MNKIINKTTSEKGITLIALIVMILIIVILSAVVISNVSNHGIIDVTSEVAEDHEIVSYKEQIEQVVYNRIINYTVRGNKPTLIDIAEALNDENWVKTAIPSTDETVNNGDIIVAVDKGYVYQVFYDDTYGKVIVDHLGKVQEGSGEDLIKSFPTIKAKYNKTRACIEVETSNEKNGIEKIEYIYKDVIVGTINNPSAKENFDVKDIGAGWYQIKVTSNKTGAFRYAWVKVTMLSESLSAPLIAKNPVNPDGENDWYKVPVTITMTTDNSNAEAIHYRILENGVVKEGFEDATYTESITISSLGVIEIYGWTTDRGENTSLEAQDKIQIDYQAPTVEYTASSSKDKVGDWYVADVELTISGEENHSGLSKYFYREKGQTTWIERNMSDKINVTGEGITEIEIKTRDKAGNESALTPISISKDTTSPEKPIIKYVSATKNSIKVEGIGNDKESGVASYTFEYKLSTEGADAWKTLTNATVIPEEGQEGKAEYTYTPIAEGEYSLRVKVKDKVNNEQISDMITQETATNSAPVFSGNPTVSKVSRSNTSLTISAQATDAEGDGLTYTLYTIGADGTEAVATEVDQNPKTANSGIPVTFTKTGLGNYSTHTFKVRVTDGIEETVSNASSGTTYCLGTYCRGGGYEDVECTQCGGTGTVSAETIPCETCGADGQIVCGGALKLKGSSTVGGGAIGYVRPKITARAAVSCGCRRS